MTSQIAPAGRRWLAAALLGPVAVLAAACSGGGGGAAASPAVTVTARPAGSSAPVAPAASAAVSTSPSPAGSAECTTAELRITTGNPNGAAGTIYYDIEFTNTSASACFLQGYPGVSLVSAPSNAGSQVGADAKRVPRYPVRPLTIGPGQTANAKLGVAEAGNFTAASCNPVTAHYLKVFPPDQTVAGYLDFTTQTCASTSQPTMTITAITAGR